MPCSATTTGKENALEVRLKSASGVVDGSILSVRVGDARRQGPLLVGTCLKFPTQRQDANPFKVDVLAPIANGRLLLTPHQDMYNLQIGEMSLQLEVSTSNSKSIDNATSTTTPATGTKKVSPEAAAREYIERYDLRGCLHSLLQSVVVEKPMDPFQYMAEKLCNRHHPTDVGCGAPGDTSQAKPQFFPPGKPVGKPNADIEAAADRTSDVSQGTSHVHASQMVAKAGSESKHFDTAEPHAIESHVGAVGTIGNSRAPEQRLEIDLAKPMSESTSCTASALTSPGSTRPASAASNRPASAAKPAVFTSDFVSICEDPHVQDYEDVKASCKVAEKMPSIGASQHAKLVVKGHPVLVEENHAFRHRARSTSPTRDQRPPAPVRYE
eukprot:gnl/MRDRNA2_/MRDRNA2_105600_c0_seq1.p1 gnl/MRDRNA2_/MRDRNA2_105600_c0~~gnl/MRDRNA2_/MRDRNA2_105600_c0_seq1.p1  ORF type:complete len:383 (+),score=67.81 gnl/MRDRNA2_/MRDRNA2_105600_c0_seq1:89-1237(+)